MACVYCKVPLNVITTLDGMNVNCTECNQSVMSCYPRTGTHVGLDVDGLHTFVYSESVVCPHCGVVAVGVKCFCDNDGGYYEVAQNQQSETEERILSKPQLVSRLPLKSSVSG